MCGTLILELGILLFIIKVRHVCKAMKGIRGEGDKKNKSLRKETGRFKKPKTALLSYGVSETIHN